MKYVLLCPILQMGKLRYREVINMSRPCCLVRNDADSMWVDERVESMQVTLLSQYLELY